MPDRPHSLITLEPPINPERMLPKALNAIRAFSALEAWPDPNTAEKNRLAARWFDVMIRSAGTRDFQKGYLTVPLRVIWLDSPEAKYAMLANM